MIRLARRASLLVAFSLLTSAATADAECAWVVWAGAERNPRPIIGDPIEWTPVRGFDTKQACVKTATEATGNPKNKAWVEFRCLPDTVDPRGPKGK
jgi:hypothetical protein